MTEYTFREFAQRYVLERARAFTPGNEREEGWKALLDVKTIFGVIEKESHSRARSEAQQAGANMTNGSTQARGVTGAAGAPLYSAFGKPLNELDADECRKLISDPGLRPYVPPSVLTVIHRRLGRLMKGGK